MTLFLICLPSFPRSDYHYLPSHHAASSISPRHAMLSCSLKLSRSRCAPPPRAPRPPAFSRIDFLPSFADFSRADDAPCAARQRACAVRQQKVDMAAGGDYYWRNMPRAMILFCFMLTIIDDRLLFSDDIFHYYRLITGRILLCAPDELPLRRCYARVPHARVRQRKTRRGARARARYARRQRTVRDAASFHYLLFLHHIGLNRIIAIIDICLNN